MFKDGKERSSGAERIDGGEGSESDDGKGSEIGVVTPRGENNPPLSGKQAAVKAGGRRRKAVRK